MSLGDTTLLIRLGKSSWTENQQEHTSSTSEGWETKVRLPASYRAFPVGTSPQPNYLDFLRSSEDMAGNLRSHVC